MYADNLILIMESNSEHNIEEYLKINSYPIIEKYGLTVKDLKTEKSTVLKEIKYLGIWHNKKEHILKNLEKAKDNYQKYVYIYANERLSNTLKTQFFKVFILPQVLYDLGIFNLTKTDIKDIDTSINKKLKNTIKIQVCTPTDILKWETRLYTTQPMILKSKANFIKKLRQLNLDHLAEDLKLDEIEDFDWENMGKIEILKKLHQVHIKSIQDKVNSSKGR
ncbi:hypothetical protein M0812_06013 [Anaeramoeba flamelloides]|uniref:Reverse transcriptase domain-containing protein n=1 Tax=Anaeramoeba flamelloides TaxID=1746091 RepID=A0AAV8ABH7_9EUKA|nr:hypothetical protein M0812_06013 [Anaeramoeba flamelloides]